MPARKGYRGFKKYVSKVSTIQRAWRANRARRTVRKAKAGAYSKAFKKYNPYAGKMKFSGKQYYRQTLRKRYNK